jgi:predicted metal-dependent hydrolase
LIDEAPRTIRLAGGTVPYLLRRSTRSRGVRLTIDDRRGLVVSIPPGQRRGWSGRAGEARAEAFLREREAWVLRHLRALDRRRAEIVALGDAPESGATVLYLGAPHRIRVEVAPAGARHTTVERAGADDGDELVVRMLGRERRTVARVLEAWLRERAAEAIDRAIEVHAPALGVAPAVIALRDPSSRWGSASKAGRLMFSWRLILAPPAALETVVVHELAHLRVFGHGPGFWKLVASRRPSHLQDRAWLRRHSHVVHAVLVEPEPRRAIAG